MKEQTDEGVGVFEPNGEEKSSKKGDHKVDQFNLNFEDPMKLGNKDWLSDLDYDQIDSLRDDDLGTPPQRPRAALDSHPSEESEPVSLLKIDPDTLFSKSFEKECNFCTNVEPRLTQLAKPKPVKKESEDPIESNEEPKTKAAVGFDVIRENLQTKYLTTKKYYNTKIVNDIIYNEPSNIVSMFKDYLIFDDVSEFLKRWYR